MIEPNEPETMTYDDIKIKLNQSPPNSIDKKRANKTETCSLCNKQLNKKTLKYFHDCQKTRSNKEKQAPIISDDQIQIYLQNQRLEHQEQQKTIRQHKLNKIIKNMV